AWSADDRQIIFASTRDNGHGVWAVDAAGGPEQRVGQSSARVIAAARASGGEIVAQAIDGASPISGPHGWLEVNGKSITGEEMVFPFRPSFLSDGTFFYVADGKIRRRHLNSAAETIPFTASLEVTPAAGTYARRKRDFDSQTPRKALGIVRPVLSPD